MARFPCPEGQAILAGSLDGTRAASGAQGGRCIGEPGRARVPKLEKRVDRAQKEVVVDELGNIFADSGVVVIAQYAGLSVAEMTDFRNRMRQAGGGVRVAKNRLARIALEGKPCEGMAKYLKGQNVFAYSEDPVAAAKVVEAFVRDNKKLAVVGGAMGATVLDPQGVKAVSEMPSREELIATVVGMIGAPAGNLVAAITSPAANIAGCLATIAEGENKAEAA